MAKSGGRIWANRVAQGRGIVSVINATQLAAIDKTWLDEFIAALPQHLMRQVDRSLRLVLGLA